MNRNRDLVVGLGEFLWDVYPDRRRPGGAPCNIAYHAAALGNDVCLATRVGDDLLGREAIEHFEQFSLSTEYVQLDPRAPTATTRVRVSDTGEPRFTVPPQVAWDHLEWTETWHVLAERADVVCYGSLALRSRRSRTTILRFLRATRPDALRVFDVHVRHAVSTPEPLAELLDLADVVKLNEREAAELGSARALTGEGVVPHMQDLRARHDVTVVCVTRGSRGSVLVTADELVEHVGYRTAVVDATGAGDAFTAAFTHWYRRGAALGAAADAANRLASWVTTKLGATPPLDPALIADLVEVRGAAESPDRGA